MFYTVPMQRTTDKQWLTLLCAGLVCANLASATTVYRTVSADGTVSFSDSPPADGSEAQALEIDTPKVQPDALQKERLEEMRDTTDRMAADRMAREKHRAELRKLQREEQYAGTPPNTDNVSYSTPDYYYRRYWNSPGYRPLPPHTRPPVRPLPSAGNYPASLIRRHYQPPVRRAFETPRR